VFLFVGWLMLLIASVASAEEDTQGGHEIAAGPLFHEFKLTLDSGARTEALGPFFYDELKETQHTWAVPPIFSYTHDPATESYEYDFIYPLLTYDRFGQQYRWQLGQLLNFAGGPTQNETHRDRYTLFPIYFQQRSSDPAQNYLAVGPFFGHMFNHLFRDEIRYVMFPVFSETRRKDVITDNWFYPIGHVRHGDGLTGWQVWPFAGHEHKEITHQTNIWHEVSAVPGHESRFILWPFYLNDHNGIGSDNPEWDQASLPFYDFTRSPKRDATTVLWPFFTWADDREKKYKEWQMPYPFIVIARGEGKRTTRFFPFFSWARSKTFESDFYLWPIYKYNRLHADPADQTERRIVFYLYWDKVLKNTETGQNNHRITAWPFFIYSREFNGNQRLQILAIIEGLLPVTKSIPRDYGPVYALWRSEKNPRANRTSQSLLWNLYRRDTGPEFRKCSLLFGLFQYESDSEGKRARLLHLISLGARRPSKTAGPG
jgi:hypothetical protein